MFQYQESNESDPPDIRDGFRELDDLLRHLPLEDNNAVFNLCCSLCTAYEHKAFLDGLKYGAQLIIPYLAAPMARPRTAPIYLIFLNCTL